MRKLLYIRLTLLLSMVISLCGCVKESGVEMGENATLTIRATRAGMQGSNEENSITKLRLIIFRTDQNGNLSSNVLRNITKTELSDFATQISQGYIRVYIIANELTTWNLDAISSENQLQSKLFDWNLTSMPQVPFPMYVQSGVVNINDASGSQTIDLALVRCIARVRLKMNCTYSEFENQYPLVIKSVQMVSMPTEPSLIPDTEYDYENLDYYYSGDETELTPSTSTVLNYTGAGFFNADNAPLVFYIPEHIISQKERCTKIKIDGLYYTGTETDWEAQVNDNANWKLTYYEIILGDGVQQMYRDTDPLAFSELTLPDLQITRNTSYEVTANFKYLGGTAETGITVIKTEWIPNENVNGEFPNEVPYLNVSETQKIVLANTPFNIHFWTNMLTATFLNIVYNKDGTEKGSLSDVFGSYPSSLSLTNGAGTGTFNVRPDGGTDATTGATSIVKLKAGNLVRDIKIIRVDQIIPASTAKIEGGMIPNTGGNRKITVDNKSTGEQWELKVEEGADWLAVGNSTAATESIYINSLGESGTFYAVAKSANPSFSPRTAKIVFYRDKMSPITLYATQDVATLLWAGSNIYWNGSQLAFTNVGVTGDVSRYQGVFFQWGSLVAISPMGGNYVQATLATNNYIVYWPTEALSLATGSIAWQGTVAAAVNQIPSGRGNTNNATATMIDIHEQTKALGDICKYMTDKGLTPPGVWRMPTAEQFNAAAANYSAYSYSGGTNDAALKNGNARIFAGRTKTAGSVYFPASGARNNNQGQLNVNPGVATGTAYYWTANQSSNNNGLYFSFSNTAAPAATANVDKRMAYPVRCVKISD